jgi:hypothetical protein
LRPSARAVENLGKADDNIELGNEAVSLVVLIVTLLSQNVEP